MERSSNGAYQQWRVEPRRRSSKLVETRRNSRELKTPIVRMTDEDATEDNKVRLATLIITKSDIPKSDIPFNVTELCTPGDECHFTIPTITTYNNYVCMGDGGDDMSCRMIQSDTNDDIELRFACQSNVFERNTDERAPDATDRCYYVGDNPIQKGYSIGEMRECIRRKRACEQPFVLKMTDECPDDDAQCIRATEDDMRDKCAEECTR
jgi:hypothetical protein